MATFIASPDTSAADMAAARTLVALRHGMAGAAAAKAISALPAPQQYAVLSGVETATSTADQLATTMTVEGITAALAVRPSI